MAVAGATGRTIVVGLVPRDVGRSLDAVASPR
jgi:hypothetical protein